jgi:hypothetical protein
MNFLENCLILLGLPIGMILAGYWPAARLSGASASERLAVAVLLGLAVLIWNISALNFFKPLNGTWSWLCLWPVALTLLDPHSRIVLLQDFSAMLLNRRGAIAAALAAIFLGLLLWPLLSRPSLVFYDGTSNHDAFFWISSAEHLKRHSYMEMPLSSGVRPLTKATEAIIGWHPSWGRMGAEGLLAFTSSIIGLAPVKLYLAATATLLVPWIAAVFLSVRTFLVGRLSMTATFALIVLQPVFVFFHGNSNLPNFVGALMAAGVVIATERSLRAGAGRGAWLVLLILSVHGLLCAYPEMLPFAVMPGGLLWLRTWFQHGFRGAIRAASLTALAWIVGAAINPASSVRGWIGFISSFDTAREDNNWANLFAPLSWIEYAPALATLSVGASKSLGPILGALLTIALIYGLYLAIRRATDPIGALFTLAGAAALLAYTLYTGFNYGLQKTVQFGGAFWAAFFPVAIVDALVRTTPVQRWARLASRAALAGVLGLFGYATIMNCLDGHKWSERKVLTQDWFKVREYAREHLAGAPVLVDGASFRMAFFHGMWATYFFADSDLYFAGRGHESGGYLRDHVINEATSPVPRPAAFLVGRDWLDTFDANSEKLFVGDTVALTKTSNRVRSWQGLEPDNGTPHNARTTIKIDLLPHSPSELTFELAPRFTGEGATQRWKISRELDGQPAVITEVSGPPPWLIQLPLDAGKSNRFELIADPAPPPDPLPPFTVRDIRIKTVGK